MKGTMQYSIEPRFLKEIAAQGKDLPELPVGYRSPELLSGLPKNTPLLLGFSGGADSSVLLFLSYLFAKKNGALLRLVHVHHGIRGDEADRDAAFAKEVADVYGLPLTLVYKDIPSIARACGESLETAARRVRYEVFGEIMREYHIPLLLTAHNADDNLETVLFHLLRGSGLSGLCGIPPTRPLAYGTVLRPLLETPRETIEAFAMEHAIPFVFDSTNNDTAYSRNRLRKEVIPLLREIAPSPERSAARMTASLRKDRDFLDSLAEDALMRADTGDGLDRETLKALPDTVALRALLLYWKKCVPSLDTYSAVHLDALLDFLCHAQNGTHLSLPQSTAAADQGRLRIVPRREAVKSAPPDFTRVLSEGESEIPALGITVFFGTIADSKDFLLKIQSIKIDEIAKNIYNSATQIYIRFDTIEKQSEKFSLCVRPRHPGDRILSRGMHRSLRTLANAAHLTKEQRDRLLVVTLGDEILWIPGLAIRDGFAEAPTDTNGKVLILSALPF